MTLKEFYDFCIGKGCTDMTRIAVEHCHLYGFGDNTTYDDHKFIIDPVVFKEPGSRRRGYTLGRFCKECRSRGCDDDTQIEVFYNSIAALDVRKTTWKGKTLPELVIFID